MPQNLEQLNERVREQWAKYARAVSQGVTGAPLAQINRKLVRLEYERDALMEITTNPEATMTRVTIGKAPVGATLYKKARRGYEVFGVLVARERRYGDGNGYTATVRYMGTDGVERTMSAYAGVATTFYVRPDETPAPPPTWAWGYTTGQRRREPRFVQAATEEEARQTVKQTMNLRKFSGSVALAEMNRKDANGRWLV